VGIACSGSRKVTAGSALSIDLTDVDLTDVVRGKLNSAAVLGRPCSKSCKVASEVIAKSSVEDGCCDSKDRFIDEGED